MERTCREGAHKVQSVDCSNAKTCTIGAKDLHYHLELSVFSFFSLSL